MKNRINTYFAILLVTVAGSGAALLIVHVALNNNFAVTTYGVNYSGITR